MKPGVLIFKEDEWEVWYSSDSASYPYGLYHHCLAGSSSHDIITKAELRKGKCGVNLCKKKIPPRVREFVYLLRMGE